jgi:hypothetical protein
MNNKRLIELQNLEVDVDPKVWRSIEAELDKKRRRGLFFILFLTGIVLSASIFFINYRESTELSDVELNSKFKIEDFNIKIGKANTNTNRKNLTSSETLIGSDYINRNDNRFTPVNDDKANRPKSKINNQENHSQNSVSESATHAKGNPINSNGELRNSDIVYKRMTANLSNDNLELLSPYSPGLFKEDSLEIYLTQRNLNLKPKKRLSRWSVAIAAGISHSDAKSLLDTVDDNLSVLKSIDHLFYSAEVKCDLSLHFAVSLGVSWLQIEQERSGPNILSYPANSIHPENYNMFTALGSITGDATLINQAVLGHDTSFNLSFSGSIPATALEEQMKVKESFQYFQIPFQVYYKLLNRKVSPFLSVSFTTGFLSSNSIYINDVKMPFNYNEKLSHAVFSTGLGVGTEIQIGRRWNAIVQGQFEKQLTPIIENEPEWKPVIFRGSCGVGFRF